jgi:adenosylmethionine-8-amino-7-oxononanoate aminotransferase
MSNADWLLRTQTALWHPCTQMKHLERMPPLPIERGEGPWLVDFDGHRYLDCISSWWVNLFGHANPRINAAIVDQLGKIEHVLLAGCTHAPVVALSERLGKLTGLGHAFYGSDGASATEIALKMSFHFWRNRDRPQKTNFISLQNGYHGETLGALSVTDVALFKDTYAPLLRQSHQLPSPDWRLAEPGESPEAYALRCADRAEAFLSECADSTAAIILEPLVQGAAGMAMYHPAYLARLRTLCDSYDVHLIADEIAVGFGRTGTLFACEQAPAAGDRGAPGIQPDLLCLSKGLTGGFLPLCAVLATQAIYDGFLDDSRERAFLHSHSYSGNPLACAAALASLDILEGDDVLARNRVTAAKMAALAAPFAGHPMVAEVRQTGMILAIELLPEPQNTDDGHAVEIAGRRGLRLYRTALDRGVLLRPLGDVLYWMPPYCVDDEQLALLADTTAACLEEAARCV